MTTNPTPVMRLSRPGFNASTWHDDVNNNMTILDGALASIGIISNIKGVWANSTFYDVEDRVASTTGLGLWANQVAHTSPAEGSFIDYLTANPGSWRPVTGGIVPRGEWAPDTVYKLNDIAFVADRGLAIICVFDHTSGADVEADITTGYWFAVIDFSALALSAADLEDAVDTTTANAATATTKAAEADADAAAALAAKIAAELAETNAETAETGAVSAQVATEAARDATLAAFDSFDDRYLGAKAADPALDNDGNALVAGSLYFNTVSGVMKVYTGAIWVASYVSGADFLAKANNLSDLPNAATARANLGVTIDVDGTLAADSDTQLASQKATKTYADTKLAKAGGIMTGGVKPTSYNAGTKSAGTFTPDYTNGNYQYATNGGAHTLAAPTDEVPIDILYTNNGTAGAITFSGFTVGAGKTGDALTTTNGHRFMISIRRINGISSYGIQALQ